MGKRSIGNFVEVSHIADYTLGRGKENKALFFDFEFEVGYFGGIYDPDFF
jgi:hypothetical protein